MLNLKFYFKVLAIQIHFFVFESHVKPCIKQSLHPRGGVMYSCCRSLFLVIKTLRELKESLSQTILKEF